MVDEVTPLPIALLLLRRLGPGIWVGRLERPKLGLPVSRVQRVAFDGSQRGANRHTIHQPFPVASSKVLYSTPLTLANTRLAFNNTPVAFSA
jgi:hypothetical protein